VCDDEQSVALERMKALQAHGDVVFKRKDRKRNLKQKKRIKTLKRELQLLKELISIRTHK